MTAAGASEGSVTSADGTRIGYRRRGSGPGLVLVQGAMGTAADFSELAEALAPAMTVITPDRRGRGTSPKPYDPGYDIARDVEDVDAVLESTGAEHVFGLSSGAVVVLEAARTLPRITGAAVYEPPLHPDSASPEGVRRLGAQIERGDLPGALITALRTAGTAPAPLRLLPPRLTRPLAAAVLAIDARRAGDRETLRDLLPGVRYDFAAVGAVNARVDSLATLDRPVLLLTGSRSPAFLHDAARRLERLLPDARRVEFDGLGHDGSWNRARGGRPDLVAPALREFFTSLP